MFFANMTEMDECVKLKHYFQCHGLSERDIKNNIGFMVNFEL